MPYFEAFEGLYLLKLTVPFHKVGGFPIVLFWVGNNFEFLK
jgi:hypothetical protein